MTVEEEVGVKKVNEEATPPAGSVMESCFFFRLLRKWDAKQLFYAKHVFFYPHLLQTSPFALSISSTRIISR